jgi:hypothetical protein
MMGRAAGGPAGIQPLLLVSSAAYGAIDGGRRQRLQARVQTSQLCFDPNEAHLEALLQGFPLLLRMPAPPPERLEGPLQERRSPPRHR